jgi:hypothetical protein
MNGGGEQVEQGEAAPGAEWPARLADTVESTVAIVYARLTRPVILAARAIAFGFLVATMALVLSVLVSIAAIRLLDVYVFPGRVWASYALVGAVFMAVGSWAWLMRRPRVTEES